MSDILFKYDNGEEIKINYDKTQRDNINVSQNAILIIKITSDLKNFPESLGQLGTITITSYDPNNSTLVHELNAGKSGSLNVPKGIFFTKSVLSVIYNIHTPKTGPTTWTGSFKVELVLKPIPNQPEKVAIKQSSQEPEQVAIKEPKKVEEPERVAVKESTQESSGSNYKLIMFLLLLIILAVGMYFLYKNKDKIKTPSLSRQISSFGRQIKAIRRI
jgi:hypothetical protein